MSQETADLLLQELDRNTELKCDIQECIRERFTLTIDRIDQAEARYADTP